LLQGLRRSLLPIPLCFEGLGRHLAGHAPPATGPGVRKPLANLLGVWLRFDMGAHCPAESLEEAVNSLLPQPLEADDPFYADLAAARGSKVLAKLEKHLRTVADGRDIRKCHIGFIGHRGCGKTTELKRLEERLSNIYYPVHLYLDNTLERDADYPDLFLWLVASVARTLVEDKVEFDKDYFERVAEWFAEVTKTVETGTSAKVEVAAEAEVAAKYGIFGTGLKLLGRITSSFAGDTKRRETMRTEMKRYAQELLTQVNGFLAHACEALKKAGKPGRLLLIQDNLDRLSREAAMNVFSANGQILTDIEAFFVWTAPVGTNLAPFNIENLFKCFYMPTISVHNRQGEPQEKAIAGLTNLVAKRLSLDLIFDKSDVLKKLVLASGGSLRDLLRLLEYALLDAQTDENPTIEESNADAAIKEFGLGIQRRLVPGNVYFPILADVALTKQWDADLGDGIITTTSVDDRRAFFHQLILQGDILEYNGDETWYDVHPVLHKIRLFRVELEKLKEEERKAKKPRSPAAKSHGKRTQD